MILFLFGEDTYRLKQKIKDMKEKYISASLGDTNLAVLEGKTVKADDIIRQALAFPFLAKSRLVIVENLLLEGKKEEQEKIGEFILKVPDTTVLVFAESGVPDKRGSLFKKLNKPKQAQEFKFLDEGGIKKWIGEEVARQKGEIDYDGIDKLYVFVGADLWRLTNEITKLVTYNPKITPKTIELLVQAQTTSDIFTLIDALANRKQTQSLKELYRLLDNGENELYILSMIVYQFRNMLVVRDLVERGINSQWEIAKMASLHPFVAGKTLNLVRRYDLAELKKIYGFLLEQDIAAKTGKMAPRTILDLLVLSLAS
ncbi:MAG: DNA polymerase III subunit delta [Candidatus Berkelbacteria bacterium]